MTRDDEATISKVMWTEFSDLRNKTQTINNYNSNDKPILLQEPKPIKQHDQKSDSEIDINLIIVIFYVTFFMSTSSQLKLKKKGLRQMLTI